MAKIKICGIKTADTLSAALSANADYIGLVFFARSPRNIGIEAAAALSGIIRQNGAQSIGLFVDPEDDFLSHVLQNTRLDMIQLHGSETPERVAAIRAKYSLPVMKALKVAEPADLVSIGAYQSVCDWLLFDAKPAVETALPGGNGHVFDWNLLRNIKLTRPWMLSGGLHSGNIKAALEILTPDAVDVSSGVEDIPGEKSIGKIRAFIQAVKQA